MIRKVIRLNLKNNICCSDHSEPFSKAVNIPIELYESSKGEYFIGYTDTLILGNKTGAWARLYNPIHSGVNLHVNVWTVTEISDKPFEAQFWFNTNPPTAYTNSSMVTCSNTAIQPVPKPKVELQLASQADTEPSGGVKAFIRVGQPDQTMVETENGKLIFPPGGSFLIWIALTEQTTDLTSGRIAFGWWEEKVPCHGSCCCC